MTQPIIRAQDQEAFSQPNGISHFKSATWTLGAALLTSAMSLATASAAPSSSWSSQPGWSNGSSSNTQTNRVAKAGLNSDSKYSAPSNISPFSPGSNNVSLELGQVFLMGNLGANYSDSIGFNLRYNYGVSDLFAFDSALGYSNHSDGKFSMFSAQAGLRTNLSWYDKVVPYLSFGLGFYKPNYTLASGTSNAPTSAGVPTTSMSPFLFGVHLGPGVDLELTKQLFFGASLTFHDVFGKTELTSDGKALDVGGTYTSFFLHAGVTF